MRLLEADSGLIPRVLGKMWNTVRQIVDRSAGSEQEHFRSDFIQAAAHDIRHPLTMVLVRAQLALKHAEAQQDESVHRDLEDIVTASRKIAALVDEFIDVSRTEVGEPPKLNLQRQDLVRIVRSVVAEQQAATEKHVLRVICPSTPVPALCDCRRIERALTNLVQNAIKYSPEGGDVLVTVRTERQWALVSVADAGIGIPHQDIEAVFEPHRRATNVGQIHGSGIGLSFARTIVHLHGGDIHIRSREDEGTTLIVRLPLSGPPMEMLRPPARRTDRGPGANEKS